MQTNEKYIFFRVNPTNHKDIYIQQPVDTSESEFYYY